MAVFTHKREREIERIAKQRLLSDREGGVLSSLLLFVDNSGDGKTGGGRERPDPKKTGGRAGGQRARERVPPSSPSNERGTRTKHQRRLSVADPTVH